MTALTLARVAREDGLIAKGYSVELADLASIPTPYVAHWEFNHFVVVERVTAREVRVVDPARGRRRFTPDEFAEGFTGVVLAFEPPPDAPVSLKPSPLAVRGFRERAAPIVRLLKGRGVGRILFQIAAASLLLQGLGIALPLFGKVVVDSVVPERAVDLLPVLGVGMALIVAAQSLTGYLRAYLLVHLQVQLDDRLMSGFVDHLLSLPYLFFQERTSGDLLDRLNSNTVLRELVSSQTTSALLDGLFVIGYGGLLLFFAPTFCAVALVLGGAQILLTLATTRKLNGMMKSELEAQASASSYSVEFLRGIGTVKSAGAEDVVFERWNRLFRTHLHASGARGTYSALVEAALGALRSASPFAVLWFGATLVLGGSLTLGSMIAYSSLVTLLLAPLNALAANIQQLQLVGAHYDRLSDVFGAVPEPRGGEVISLRGRIEFRDVRFRYDDNGPWVLDGVSFVIEPGQKVAVVGRSGAGKSTVIGLLLRLLTPASGQILVDGRPVETLDSRALRQQVGVVLQEPFLSSGSIRENLSFRNPTADLRAVQEKAAVAAIHEDIEALPLKYETPLGEGGSGLSGGQRQRIALAQALVHDPAVLVLDEATSHLDPVTESLVDERLSQLSCTRLVIAHRLSTVRNADRILVLEGGGVVERGTHEDLVALGGAYAALVAAPSGAVTGADQESKPVATGPTSYSPLGAAA